MSNALVDKMRSAAEGEDWPWMATLLREGAGEIDCLRTALELIARGSGGVPGPRLFARDVLDGNIILLPMGPLSEQQDRE